MSSAQALSVRLDLRPDDATRERLIAYLSDVNECCNWLSLEAEVAHTYRRFDLQRLTYHRAREVYPLRADAVLCAIAKVARAYALKNGPRRFRPTGSIPIKKKDFRIGDGFVRIALLDGHVSVPFTCRPGVNFDRHGEGILGVSNGRLVLIVAITATTPVSHGLTDALGVDLGIANIATDSDGNRYSGAALRGVRHRKRRLRARLQSKQTRSAKRRLKRMRRKESRFGRDVNHCISKQLVAAAERTKSAIVLEDLKGITRRVRATRRQRAELSSWSFYQLREFITYKAALAGVPVILVDPRNTSRECSECGHVDKRNRQNQATFKCRACGHTAHADLNAALVIRSRALLSVPYATSLHGLVASPFGVN